MKRERQKEGWRGREGRRERREVREEGGRKEGREKEEGGKEQRKGMHRGKANTNQIEIECPSVFLIPPPMCAAHHSDGVVLTSHPP